ncbi:MAG: class B sortase [Lachnospiraceae bacterium]|nr:class B sortase [Lachnospiraceae bacterium]
MNPWKLDRIIRRCDAALVWFVTFGAVLLLMYSIYVLYDTVYTGQNAFTSYDLLQYRPKTDETGSLSFEDLFSVSEDAVGWLSIEGTHINYPLVQGKDNLKYANTNVYGKPSLTGSIFMAAENAPDLSDYYTIIYGHHMSNGAMFGDIDNYENRHYFDIHRNAIIQMPSGNYDVEFFALMDADAYDIRIYTPGNVEPESILGYIREKALIFSEDYDSEKGEAKPVDKLLALSTCKDAVTNGRVVLFGSVKTRLAPLPVEEEEEEEGVFRIAIGHISDSDHWSFLNLLLAALTIYIFVPLGNARRKFRQIPYSKKTALSMRMKGNHNPWIAALSEEGRLEKLEKIERDLDRFVLGMFIGIALEALAVIASVALFAKTENLAKRAVILDDVTPFMLGVAAFALLADFIFFRYRGELLPKRRDK